MDQKDPEKTQKTGLREALHPEIGNGSSLDSDSNDSNHSSIYPYKILDSFLLDQYTSKNIIERWNQQLTSSEGKSDISQESDNLTTFPETSRDEGKAKRKE